MLQFVSAPQSSEEAVEIERFRARHRRLLRTRQQQIRGKVENLDEDDGRRRKVSSKWRQTAQKSQQNENWRRPVSSMNAFDFPTSCKGFNGAVEAPCDAQQDEQRMTDVARQVTSMGFHYASTWQGMSNWEHKSTHYPVSSDLDQTLQP
ncbi:hypothetical protein DVH05_001212 [Phytophthora capsici]|nr:hypothetical protein DVH05_001212 [Phytophthora capsici]